MPFIPEGYANIEYELEIPGDAGPALVVFGVGPVTAFNASEVATIVADALNNAGSFREFHSTNVIGRKVTARRAIGGGDIAIAELSVNNPGALGGAVAPPQVATLIGKSTGLAGRANRGRMYVPGVLDADVNDDGTFTTVRLNGLQAAANTFLGDLDTLEVPMVILHNDPADTPTTVNQLNVSAKVATQRRRLR